MFGSLRMWIGPAMLPACWSPAGIAVRSAAVVLVLCWVLAAVAGASSSGPRPAAVLLEPIGDFTPWCSTLADPAKR